jgi:hypothetical protein
VNARAVLRNQLLGFICQGFNLLPRTNALENVETPLVYSGVRGAELFAELYGGLSAEEKKVLSSLSGKGPVHIDDISESAGLEMGKTGTAGSSSGEAQSERLGVGGGEVTGKVTKKTRHICWDGCMFPNDVMRKQETWNNILASMIQVRENHGWRE